MYEEPFYINTPVSNNAFSFDKRVNKRIRVAALKDGFLENLRTGTEIVFEDYDDEERLKSCTGLENFIRCEIYGHPAYVFDNHNHAFAFWCKEAAAGLFGADAALAHVDMHRDMREPAQHLSACQARDEEAFFRYTNSELNVGNFVPAALRAGLFSRVLFIDSESAVREFDARSFAGKRIVLDLDMDFFSPEMNYIDKNLKTALIRDIAKKSSLITIATSPFFMDQEAAIGLINGIFTEE